MGEPVSRVQANMSSMAYQSLARGILPVLGIEIDIIEDMVYPEWRNFADFGDVRKSLAQYREWVGKFAKIFGIDYIDIYRLFKEHGSKNGRGLYSDGLHLNVEGNRFMASVVFEEMEKFTSK
jgi:lysophospholipase L1-like esterase